MREILVQKEVLITDKYMDYEQKGWDVINIVDPNDKDGFTNFVIALEMTQQCCENANIFIENDEDIFGKTMYVEKIVIDSNKFKWNEYVSEYEQNAISSEEIYLQLKDRTIGIALTNDHNGYYSHDIFAKSSENGEIMYEYSSAL